MRWPAEASYAFTCSFHLDAETLWTSRDPANADRPGLLSQGRFGPKVGVDLILKMLAARGLASTFFVPGRVAETYPHVVRRVFDAGHEIGHHGYKHEHLAPDDPAMEIAVMDAGLEALKAVTGEAPKGYCSPAWEITPHTIPLLLERGFQYSTNFMDDIQPYLHKHPGSEGSIVELPVHWTLDDAPFRLFSPQQPRPIRSARAIGEIWREETAGIAHHGGLVNLVMHPQVTGRPAMLEMLGEFLDSVLSPGNAYVDRNDRVAAWAKKQLTSPDRSADEAEQRG